MKYLILTILFCGVAAGQSNSILTSGTSGTASVLIISQPQLTGDGPSEHLSVESLTTDEQKQLDAARKQLSDIEAKVRKSHGESVRSFEGGATTADCKGSQTIVEIHEMQALIRTEYAGRGNNPGCF